MKVSLDGGTTYVEAPEGIRVIYENIEADIEEGVDVEFHLNCTEEGLVYDVWTPYSHDSLGTQSQTVNDLVEELINRRELK